jgi:thioredoxin reductase (NADPH)
MRYKNMEKRKVIIIGSGPAGLTAAIYTARANLSPLVFEGFQSGGQLMITSEVENFPGFSKGINGPELMDEMRAQAEKFGTEFISSDVSKVEFSADKKIVWDEDNAYEADTIIIATGATANLLGMESESRLMGRGVSACATCDGFFFKDRTICVIGGGDSALEEATYLTRFAKKVYVIHRREEFRASKIMVDKAQANQKIEFKLCYIPDEILGEDRVKGIRLLNKKTNETEELPLDGVFIAIGHTPATKLFKDQLKTDEKGYLLTDQIPNQRSSTSIPGVFACGDVQDNSYKQAITAAGSGCVAALDAERYLEALEEKKGCTC